MKSRGISTWYKLHGQGKSCFLCFDKMMKLFYQGKSKSACTSLLEILYIPLVPSHYFPKWESILEHLARGCAVGKSVGRGGKSLISRFQQNSDLKRKLTRLNIAPTDPSLFIMKTPTTTYLSRTSHVLLNQTVTTRAIVFWHIWDQSTLQVNDFFPLNYLCNTFYFSTC